MIDELHVVVLAGGEGSRLQSLTRALYGCDLPKQFAVLAGKRSLMQSTVERAMRLTTPAHISVVVTAHQEPIAREQLAPYRGVELVVQPRNLDTGPGLLLPLVRILARSPAARVVFLPSDHYVPNETPLVDALREADPDAIALVGVEPTGPEVEYGWIVPGAPLGRGNALRVERFHEKPEPVLAEHLHRLGGLWNTFILSGPALAFWELARRHLPGHAAALAVIPVRGTGWSDWGSPSRVFASLAGTPLHDDLVERIRDVA